MSQDLPDVLQENKARWCKLLLKTKPIQDIFSEFTNRIAMIMEKEVKNNAELLGKYLKHPRITSDQVEDFKRI